MSGPDLLRAIAEARRRRVAEARRRVPVAELERRLLPLLEAEPPQQRAGAFRRALEGGRHEPFPRVIAEVKRASPAAGVFGAEADAVALARAYVAGGAAAVSVLTEPDYFLGRDEDLRAVAAAVPVPVLRKDFVLEEYQLYESRLLGAHAVLLIAALLTAGELAALREAARRLGMGALVEVASPEDVERALAAGADVIGINNRDLKTFRVDLGTTERLRALLPEGVTVVAASGVRSAADARRLAAAGVDALLVGEALVRSGDPARALVALRGAAPAGVARAREGAGKGGG